MGKNNIADDTNRIGYATEFLVEGKAYNIGIDISVPVSPLRYDQIWDINTHLIKVQIKHASPIIKDNIIYGFKFTGKNYKEDEIDGIATIYNDKLYFIPIKQSSNENKLYFIIDQSIETNPFKWANDYEVTSIKKLRRLLKKEP